MPAVRTSLILDRKLCGICGKHKKLKFYNRCVKYKKFGKKLASSCNTCYDKNKTEVKKRDKARYYVKKYGINWEEAMRLNRELKFDRRFIRGLL